MSDSDGQVRLPDLNAASMPAIDDVAYHDEEQASRIAADLEAVFDVPVQVSAVLGRSKMDVGELLKLGPGTVLELDRRVGEAIDIYVNNRLVARAAVTAIHAGAKEYIPLPPDPELIAAVLAAVANDTRDLVYRDEAMVKVIKLAQQIAGSDASVMITGESGTGKEVLARHVHTRSNRAKRPFISINCAAIPEHLLESELFGHEKGAFTGAVARRIGKFEEATGGTLLLDEISEMDVRLQSKLLRAIQERVIDRVGGTRPVPVDIRIIATSNRNLADAVREGTFREDLLFRLNVVNLKIPPLRERPADILELAQHFAKKYADANGVPVRPISADARRVLTGNRWQGNVRELENTIHRSVLMAQGDEIGADAILTPSGDRLDLAKTVPAVAHGTLPPQQGTPP